MHIPKLAAGAAFLMLAAQSAGEPLLLQPLMKGVVAPQAQVLWDVGNRGMDDEGRASAAKLTAVDWAALGTAGQAMKDAAIGMGAPGPIQLTAPGAELQDEGTPGASTPAQIQGYIDADRTGWAAASAELVKVSDELIAAAASKDAQALMDASGRLDQVCEACHMRFWYPEQK